VNSIVKTCDSDTSIRTWSRFPLLCRFCKLRSPSNGHWFFSTWGWVRPSETSAFKSSVKHPSKQEKTLVHALCRPWREHQVMRLPRSSGWWNVINTSFLYRRDPTIRTRRTCTISLPARTLYSFEHFSIQDPNDAVHFCCTDWLYSIVPAIVVLHVDQFYGGRKTA